jgi:hypothetical protein
MTEHGDEIDSWRKSTASGDAGCVEVHIGAERICVRDTKNRPGTFLTFTHQEWQAFLTGVRLGEFDLPGTESA